MNPGKLEFSYVRCGVYTEANGSVPPGTTQNGTFTDTVPAGTPTAGPVSSERMLLVGIVAGAVVLVVAGAVVFLGCVLCRGPGGGAGARPTNMHTLPLDADWELEDARGEDSTQALQRVLGSGGNSDNQSLLTSQSVDA